MITFPYNIPIIHTKEYVARVSPTVQIQLDIIPSEKQP